MDGEPRDMLIVELDWNEALFVCFLRFLIPETLELKFGDDNNL